MNPNDLIAQLYDVVRCEDCEYFNTGLCIMSEVKLDPIRRLTVSYVTKVSKNFFCKNFHKREEK